MFEKLPMFTRTGGAALKANLDNIAQLCTALGNPHLKYKVIHVAGTNGKGTVSHLLAAALQSQGYKVGLHTSPHYKDLRERFKVNGRLSTKSFVTRFVTQHQELIARIQPSFFEITVAMSFQYFAEQNCDYTVIEVGLGGRLDSTNIVRPILSVITNISKDHTEFLGDTYAAIAGEKAGIIKPSVPVVIGEYHEETAPVFIEIAKKNGSEISFAEDQIWIKNIHQTLFSTTFQDRNGLAYSIDISGPFQDKNINTAFASINELEKQGIQFERSKLRNTLKNFKSIMKYMGRWQVLQKSPTVLVDSAHNEGGMEYVLNMLNKHNYNQLHIVLGFVKDKDRTKILPMLPITATYYFVKADLPRGLPASDLQIECANFGLIGHAYTSVLEGFQSAKNNAKKEDLVFVGGSIFVVAEVL